MIEITHGAGEGTLLTGDPRPHHQIVKDAGFRWSRNIGSEGAWYVPRSRDRAPNVAAIERLAEALRAVGFEVAVDVVDEVRAPAEREAAIAERSEERAERLEARADRLGAAADAAYGAARQTMDMIPFGQPILVGHHSEGRHRRDLARIDRNIGKSVELGREADETARRARAAVAHQAQRESLPVTLRRIQRLEAERRKIERRIEGKPCVTATAGIRLKVEAVEALPETGWHCRFCGQDVLIGEDRLIPLHYREWDAPPTGEALERWEGILATLNADIAYWGEHRDSLIGSGVKVWGPADFKPGDIVNGDELVIRVNPKTLTVQPRSISWTLKRDYSSVHSKKGAVDG